MQALSNLWKRIGDISLAAWLWNFLPASLAGAIVSWFAYLGAQPAWVIALAALAAFALFSWGLAAWRSQKISSIRAESFDDLRARVRDRKLAELLGEQDAERAAKNRVSLAALGIASGGMSKTASDLADESEARRKARLRRIEMGEDE